MVKGPTRRLDAAALKENGITIDEDVEWNLKGLTEYLIKGSPQVSSVA